MKTSHTLYVSCLLLAICCLSSCTSMRQLSAHQQALQRLAYGDMPPQEKFDGLAITLVGVIDESLRIINPEKTYRYLQKFSQQNEQELNLLYEELNAWREGMSGPQKVAFGARTLSKPYTRRLMNLNGKLQKRIGSRYTQLTLLAKVAGVLKVKMK
ncbi:MAG: hypothetical protein D6730_06420 [Bacteroidetes bacterium]|nr:MAG: hypothetical protein D6730_06420 [Bacteroidota bacterium]